MGKTSQKITLTVHCKEEDGEWVVSSPIIPRWGIRYKGSQEEAINMYWKNLRALWNGLNVPVPKIEGVETFEATLSIEA